MGKHTRKPPSRIRYEETHPVVSCRVPRITYDLIQQVKETQGRSLGDMLRIGMGTLKVQFQNEDEIRKEAYAEGHDDGFDEAEQKFKVAYPCSVCGGIVVLESENEKKAASKYMQEHRWSHSRCLHREQ